MLRTDRKKKDGSFPVVLRVTINRKIKYFPLNFDVYQKDFIEGNLPRVKKTDPHHFTKNASISNVLAKIASIERHFIRIDKQPELHELISQYQNETYNPDSVFDFIDYLIRTRQTELADSTIAFYKKQKSKLKDFRSEIKFGDVDLRFLNEYKAYLVSTRKNSEITWNKSLEFVRRVLNAALKEDRIHKNPFIHFPIKNVKGTLDHLTLEEVSALEKLYQQHTLLNGQQNVLQYFLFACYTGLRYGDIYSLRFSNIKSIENNLWLEFRQQKTGKQTQVPLIPQAENLLPEKKFENQKVFRVVPNQTTNRHLKTIIEKLEIDKRITFHSARHTCSNLLYRLEVPVEIRSLIVGDTVEVVRGNYTHTDQKMILAGMGKFSEALNKN